MATKKKPAKTKVKAKAKGQRGYKFDGKSLKS